MVRPFIACGTFEAAPRVEPASRRCRISGAAGPTRLIERREIRRQLTFDSHSSERERRSVRPLVRERFHLR
jgi:hypothetical protein